MVGEASLIHDELITTVTEIESIINSRPLVYFSAGDIEEPLTRLSCSFVWPGKWRFWHQLNPTIEENENLSSMLTHFWKWWKSEYLAELRESHRHLQKSVSVGVLLVVNEEGVPRSFWKLGRIQDLITGKLERLQLELSVRTYFLKLSPATTLPIGNQLFLWVMDNLQEIYNLRTRKLRNPRRKTGPWANLYIHHDLNTQLQKRAKRNEDSGPASCWMARALYIKQTFPNLTKHTI